MRASSKTAWLARTALALILISSVSSCLGIGDGVLKLRGEISKPGDPICRLQLLLEGSNKVYDSRGISGKFEVSFVVAPKKHMYRFIVKCEDGSVHQLPSLAASGSSYAVVPFDLGLISRQATEPPRI